MRVLLAFAMLVLVAPPAAAIEGRFADPAGDVRLEIKSDGGDGLIVTLEGPFVPAPLVLALEPVDGSGLLQESTAPLSLFERLTRTAPRRLPFEGARLAFGRWDDEALVVTTLKVDDRGRPTLNRIRLREAPEGIVLEQGRYTIDSLAESEPLLLGRVTP